MARIQRGKLRIRLVCLRTVLSDCLRKVPFGAFLLSLQIGRVFPGNTRCSVSLTIQHISAHPVPHIPALYLYPSICVFLRTRNLSSKICRIVFPRGLQGRSRVTPKKNVQKHLSAKTKKLFLKPYYYRNTDKAKKKEGKIYANEKKTTDQDRRFQPERRSGKNNDCI